VLAWVDHKTVSWILLDYMSKLIMLNDFITRV